MAVYLIEIPDNSPREYSQEDVERILKESFPLTPITVRNKFTKTLKILDWEEEYTATMAAG